MRTTLSTVATVVKAKADGGKNGAQEMDRLPGGTLKINRKLENQKKVYQELTRITDLPCVLRANSGSFYVLSMRL